MIPDFFDRIFGRPDSDDEVKSSGDPGNRHLGLVAGLGNPGEKYAFTRHNIGFLVLDRFAEDEDSSFKNERKWEAEAFRHGGVVYLKPKTYMNESGRAVSRAAKFHGIEPERVLIVADDVTLPLGSLRIRRRGSSGGHNGLKSVAQALGGDGFPRMRVGVGRGGGSGPGRQPDLAKHVLGRFGESERSLLEQAIDKAIEALRVVRDEGFDAAMTRFNRRGEGAEGSQKQED